MRYLLPLFLLFALVGCEEEQHESTNARPVVSEIVGTQAGSRSSYIGSVVARTETDLGFPISGTLETRPVQVGDVVETGTVIAQIDPVDLDASVRAAEAGVVVAKAQLNTTRDTANRVNKLVAKGVDTVSRAQLVRSSLVAAEAALKQAQAELRQAEESRGFAELAAPHKGVVTQIYLEPGAALAAGQSVVRLATIGEREAIIDLSEQDVAALLPGAAFEVWLLAAPQVAASARLRLIDPVTDNATRTRRLHLTLDTATSAEFRLGALVQVEPAAGNQAQPSLPVSAIRDGEPAAVWIVNGEDRRVASVPVTLGRRDGVRVVITSGLQEGQEVIVKGVNSIREGQQVGPHAIK